MLVTIMTSKNDRPEGEGTPTIINIYADKGGANDEAPVKMKSEPDTENVSVALGPIPLDPFSGPTTAIKPASSEVSVEEPDDGTVLPDHMFVEQFQALGISRALNRVAKIDPTSDAEQMVVQYLVETGLQNSWHLFDQAFPDFPDPVPERDIGEDFEVGQEGQGKNGSNRAQRQARRHMLSALDPSELEFTQEDVNLRTPSPRTVHSSAFYKSFL